MSVGLPWLIAFILGNKVSAKEKWNVEKESTRSSSNKWTKTLYQDYLFNFFLTTPIVENKFWISFETLENTGEKEEMMKFYLCLQNFLNIEITISSTHGKLFFFFSYFLRQLFAVIKWTLLCYNVFINLKAEIVLFTIGFRFKLLWSRWFQKGS